jgi:hypothetical protein
MPILIVDSNSLRKIKSNEYNSMGIQGLSIFSNVYFSQWTHDGGLLVILSICGEFGLVSTSFNFWGPDGYFGNLYS